MGPKSKKIPVRGTQNIDNVLFENCSRPRLLIMVTKNEPERLTKIKIVVHNFFAATEKLLTKN